MKTVLIAGVPEHFNLPWHMAVDDGLFRDRGIDLIWKDVPEGTGKMAQMLRDGETDLAVILTEGIIKSIAEGNPARIIQEYIASPLRWGIHVSAKSTYTGLDQLQDTTAAISRFGSGSHLMAYINAKANGWDTGGLDFLVVNTLDGAVTALSNGGADYFLWERFTTKPLVDQGIFRHLGDCPTPWPCFVIAVSQRFAIENPTLPGHILEVINTVTRDFKAIPSIDRTLANTYKLKLPDVQAWLAITQWSQQQINEEVVDNVQNTLFDLNLLSNKVAPSAYLWKLG